jgi:TonB family protein
VLDNANPVAWRRSPVELQRLQDVARPAASIGGELDRPPRRAEEPRRRGNLGFLGLIALAASAHAGVLGFLGYLPSDLAGAGGVELEAVSVEVAMVSASALESRATAAVRDGGSQSFDFVTGSTVHPTAAAAEAKPETRPPPTSAPLVIEPDPEPAVADVSAVAASRRQEPPVKDQEAIREEKKSEPTPAPATPAAEAPEGAAASRALRSEQRSASAAAAASPGAVLAYARSVVAALGKNRPKGGRSGKGTVRVVFAVGDGGAVEDIAVKQSSGRAELDGLAIAAVRQTRFPPPPAGMSRSARTYEVPYHFR